MTWTWPKNIGSSDVGDDTEVPNVDRTYNFVTNGDPGYGEDPSSSDRTDEMEMPTTASKWFRSRPSWPPVSFGNLS